MGDFCLFVLTLLDSLALHFLLIFLIQNKYTLLLKMELSPDQWHLHE